MLLLLLAPLLLQDAGALLRVQVEPGQCWRYELTSESRYSERRDQDPEITVRNLTKKEVVEFLVLDRTDDFIRLRRRLISTQVLGIGNGIEVDYDSSRGDAPDLRWDSPAYAPSHLVGQSYVFTINTKGYVESVSDFEALVDSLLASAPDAQLVRQSITTELLSAAGEGLLPRYPLWKCRPGAQWSSRSTISLGEGLAIQMRTHYKAGAVSVENGTPTIVVHARGTSDFSGDPDSGFFRTLAVSGETNTGFHVALVSGIPHDAQQTDDLAIELTDPARGVTSVRRLCFRGLEKRTLLETRTK